VWEGLQRYGIAAVEVGEDRKRKKNLKKSSGLLGVGDLVLKIPCGIFHWEG